LRNVHGLFRFIPTPANLKFKKRVAEYKKFFRGIISNFNENHAHRDDIILYHLINGAYDGRKLKEDEIIDQIYTVIGAGYESTGAVLHWLLYEISKRKDLIIKLREEIEPLGSHENWNHENTTKCELLQRTLLSLWNWRSEMYRR